MADLIKKGVVIGLNQTRKSLLNDEAEILYVADNADWRLVEPIVMLAEEKNIAIERVATMKKLGKRLGIDVGAAAGVVLKQ